MDQFLEAQLQVLLHQPYYEQVLSQIDQNILKMDQLLASIIKQIGPYTCRSFTVLIVVQVLDDLGFAILQRLQNEFMIEVQQNQVKFGFDCDLVQLVELMSKHGFKEIKQWNLMIKQDGSIDNQLQEDSDDDIKLF